MTNPENITLDYDATWFRVVGAVRRYLLAMGQPDRAALFLELMVHPTTTP